MTKETFLSEYNEILENYSRMSQQAGVKPDIVQGGGGNTSVKLDGNLMAIKASGFRLDQITPEDGYAVLDYRQIAGFYAKNAPESFDDVEKAGAAVSKSATLEIEGMAALRPSVEAGFHSILKKYVLHTHPVYANLACCCKGGRDIINEAMAGADYTYVFVPYINPGASLTFAIASELNAAEKEGKSPSAVFMQNHGLIATDDDPEVCASIHEDANRRIAAVFGLDMESYPAVGISELEDGRWRSDTAYLKNMLCGNTRGMEFFTDESLYPDQMVYLTGALELRDGEYDGSATTAVCTVFNGSGDVIYNAPRNTARTIEETLTALMFIHNQLKTSGHEAATMSESGKDFIANWESEKYRKQLAQSGTK